MELRSILSSYLRNGDAGWSMGTFGALAEFHQEPGEKLLCNRPDRLVRATARGAIRLEATDALTPIAYETLSPSPERWSHGVALCLREPDAVMSRRSAIAELGPDDAAVRPSDRTAILFDMGLSVTGPGCRQVDFCVRTEDGGLIAELRAAEGRSILDASTGAMQTILDAHPHRVALTRGGRIEVYQPIGGPLTGGVSPAGPHTHVLPKLLASGRTHSANIPVGDGLVPCAFLYPPSPVTTALGRDKAFDTAHHRAFQALLEAWGPPAFVDVKRAVTQAVDEGQDPAGFEIAGDRLARTAVRVALRQLHRQAASDRERARIAGWRSRLDAAKVPEDPLDAQHVGKSDARSSSSGP